MKVSEVMHKNASWVPPTMSIQQVAKMMKEQDIGAVPVGENDRLIGMVTDRDIAIRAWPNGHDISSLTARDVMSPGISYCHADDPLQAAVQMMESRKIRRLPVIDTDKRMVGMLSIGDVSHAGGGKLTEGLMQAVSGHHA